MRIAMRLPIAILTFVLGACGGAGDDSDMSGAGGSSQAGATNAGGDSAQAGSSASGSGGSSQGGSSPGVGGTGGAATGGSAGASQDSGVSAGGSAGTSGVDAAAHDAGMPFDAAMCPVIDAGSTSSRQTPKQLGSTSAPNGYLEYLPPCYDKAVAMPLLVFWHGIGEDGNGMGDLNKVTSWGPPKLIANNKWDQTRPFIVLSPQYTSANGGGIAPGAGCPSSATINAFFTWALSNYNVDRKRVYLTGLSCGAIGSWDYLANFPGTLVAAAALLSGNPGDPTQVSSTWKRVGGCPLGAAAIWSFHGDADGTVPYAPDQATLQDLIACPMPPRRDARFTDVPGGGHIIWDPIYDLTGGYGDIYQWMLANAKP